MARKEKPLSSSSRSHKKKSSRSHKSHSHKHSHRHKHSRYVVDPQSLAVAIATAMQAIQKDKKGKGRELRILSPIGHRSRSRSTSSQSSNKSRSSSSDRSSRSSSRSSSNRTSDSSSSDQSGTTPLGRADREHLRVSNHFIVFKCFILKFKILSAYTEWNQGARWWRRAVEYGSRPNLYVAGSAKNDTSEADPVNSRKAPTIQGAQMGCGKNLETTPQNPTPHPQDKQQRWPKSL